MAKGIKTGGGSRKGKPNKLTADLKAIILAAAENAHPEGTLGYLTQQAQTNPNAFMTILGKVLPLTVAGDPENPLAVRSIERHIVRPAD